jgi:tRNA threonylcarbamoyl adenosine modification protein YeaZ
LVLAFDTATDAVASCLWRDGTALAERELRGEPHAAQSLLGAVDALRREAGVGLDELDAVVVGTGPGSYTGVRIGIAAARGLAFGLGVPVSGVSTLDALRAEAALGGDQATAVIDARRGEVFAAGPSLEPAALTPAALAALLPRGATCVGDGAVRYRAVLERGGALVPRDEDALHLVRARAHARLAVERGLAASSDPLYLRRPDAEAAVA